MSFESEFADFMPASITQKPFVRTDANGVDVFSSSRTISGRVEMIHEKVLDRMGNERISQMTLYLKPTDGDSNTVTIAHNDEITLPSGYSTEIRPILAVERGEDDAGLHHWQVML